MKLSTFLQITGLALFVLAGCVTPKTDDHVTAWGTRFVYDDEKVHAIHYKLFDCLIGKQFPDDATAQDVKDYVRYCDEQYDDEIYISHTPPVIYGLTGQVESKTDPYEEFWMCVHTLANPMMDLPSDYTRQQILNDINHCLLQWPYLIRLN